MQVKINNFNSRFKEWYAHNKLEIGKLYILSHPIDYYEEYYVVNCIAVYKKDCTLIP